MANGSGRRGRRTLVIGLTTMLPSILLAQARTAALAGVVRDSGGIAIPGVEVRLDALRQSVRTNDSGGFRMAALPSGMMEVSVRRIGFAPAKAMVRLRSGRTDSLVVLLSAVPVELPAIAAEDAHMKLSRRLLAGFWDRRDKGFGSFMTREQIEERAAHDFVDLVRQIPSVRVSQTFGRSSIRFNRNVVGRDCPPQFFVDGMRIENGSPDEFVPDDVEAIELYPGSATLPVQFAPRPTSYTCGAVVIWTRLPGG